jgi:hypothetical protein
VTQLASGQHLIVGKRSDLMVRQMLSENSRFRDKLDLGSKQNMVSEQASAVRRVGTHSVPRPTASTGWFIMRVLITSAGVPKVAATSPAHPLAIA